jgi:magnesium transporter
MRHPLLAPDLRELVQERAGDALRDFFTPHHPAGSAELLCDLEPDEVKYVLDLLPASMRAEIFTYLDTEVQDALVGAVDAGWLAGIVSAMSHDERADLVGRLPEERAEEVLQHLARAEREDIRRLTAYRDGTAGAVMTSDYATLPPDATAADALAHLRHEAPDRETIYYCYVVDSDRRLVGMVSLKDLIRAPASRRVSDFMLRDVVFSYVDEDQEEVARKLMEYDLIALPIVDREDRLVGIVTHDDVIDVIVDEATEDVHRLGGVQPLADSYLRTAFVSMWWNRGMWLAILFVGGFLTATALERYGETFRAIPALVFFIPLIISAGGNCGSQSATLITRALALGEVTPGDWFRVVWHEVLMGALLGITLGLVGLARVALFPPNDLSGISIGKLAATVSLGVAIVVLCGNLVGATLPLVLKRMHLDPALMSNPVVASLVDVTGIVAYCAIADMTLR